MNIFSKLDGSVDREFLRVCAVYRLFARNHISKDMAVELLRQVLRAGSKPEVLVSMWVRSTGMSGLPTS